jgi:hypothetical protein
LCFLCGKNLIFKYYLEELWIQTVNKTNSKIDISQHCKEQDLEIYAIQLETKTSNLIILSLYKAPSGGFQQFLRGLDATLKYLYNQKTEFLICGVINIDYLNQNYQKIQINSLLTSYNLIHTVNFATRIENDSRTAIDNTFWG